MVSVLDFKREVGLWHTILTVSILLKYWRLHFLIQTVGMRLYLRVFSNSVHLAKLMYILRLCRIETIFQLREKSRAGVSWKKSEIYRYGTLFQSCEVTFATNIKTWEKRVNHEALP